MNVHLLYLFQAFWDPCSHFYSLWPRLLLEHFPMSTVESPSLFCAWYVHLSRALLFYMLYEFSLSAAHQLGLELRY